MSITNSVTNTPNSAQLIDTAKDLSNTAEGQQIMSGRHSSGEGVKNASSAKNDMLDALEELGMAKSHRAKVDAQKLKVKKGAGTDLDALGRIAEYLDKLPNLPSEQKYRELAQRFSDFADSFARGDGAGAGAEDIWAALRDYDDDISHQFAALEALRADAADQKAPSEYLALLDEVRSQMRQPQQARDIMAGFRAAQTANSVAQATGADAADFRETYRTILRDGTNLSAIFERMKGFSAKESLGDILDGFVRVAGADLAAFGPSADPQHLRAVLTELRHLRQMVSVMSQAQDMLDNAVRLPRAGETAHWPDATAIAGKVLEFTTARIAAAAKGTELVDMFPTSDVEFRASLISLVLDFHAGLPKFVAPSEQQVVQQKDILMTIADKLVQAEEVELG